MFEIKASGSLQASNQTLSCDLLTENLVAEAVKLTAQALAWPTA
jgi:hypothetical protein